MAVLIYYKERNPEIIQKMTDLDRSWSMDGQKWYREVMREDTVDGIVLKNLIGFMNILNYNLNLCQSIEQLDEVKEELAYKTYTINPSTIEDLLSEGLRVFANVSQQIDPQLKKNLTDDAYWKYFKQPPAAAPHKMFIGLSKLVCCAVMYKILLEYKGALRGLKDVDVTADKIDTEIKKSVIEEMNKRSIQFDTQQIINTFLSEVKNTANQVLVQGAHIRQRNFRSNKIIKSITDALTTMGMLVVLRHYLETTETTFHLKNLIQHLENEYESHVKHFQREIGISLF